MHRATDDDPQRRSMQRDEMGLALKLRHGGCAGGKAGAERRGVRIGCNVLRRHQTLRAIPHTRDDEAGLSGGSRGVEAFEEFPLHVTGST
jgi:hypothetical protein